MKWNEDGTEVTLTLAEFNEWLDKIKDGAVMLKEFALRTKNAEESSKKSSELLAEAIKKDVTLKRVADLEQTLERMTARQHDLISKTRDFLSGVLVAGLIQTHEKDCMCSICDPKYTKSLRGQLSNRVEGLL